MHQPVTTMSESQAPTGTGEMEEKDQTSVTDKSETKVETGAGAAEEAGEDAGTKRSSAETKESTATAGDTTATTDDTTATATDSTATATDTTTAAAATPSAYVLVDITGTGSDQTRYTAKDSSEIIEIAWSIVDSKTLAEEESGHRLVKPINTPITPLCTSLTGLTWSSVKDAGTLKDAIDALCGAVDARLVRCGKTFTFVSFTSWDLRMRLSKEAREKSIPLAQYVRHPRYVDLKREYVRYREAAGAEFYSNSRIDQLTMSEVIAQLGLDDGERSAGSAGVDESQVGAQIDAQADGAQGDGAQVENAQVSDGAQADGASAGVAEKNVRDMRRILAKLFPAGAATAPIPHDLALDLAEFYREASRVLYITNLPLDVTQSELESWFSQFGCRPIAFWTVKAPLPEFTASASLSASNAVIMRASCSGFVIFGSHETASDALAMNGRVLNDRIIEVQPSSSKILDKAQEIITPFPSSKNRPRPGDWTCPSCGFSNFQRRTACFRCSFPATSAHAVQESLYGETGSGSGAGAAGANIGAMGATGGAGDAVGAVGMAGVGGPEGSAEAGADVSDRAGSDIPFYRHNQHHHPHAGQRHTGRPYNARAGPGHRANFGSSNVPFRAGDWKCMNENCAYHNFAKNVCCLKCGAPRMQSAIITGHVQGGGQGYGANAGQSPNQYGAGQYSAGQYNAGQYGAGQYAGQYQRANQYVGEARSYSQPYAHQGYTPMQFASASNTPVLGGADGLDGLSTQISGLSLRNTGSAGASAGASPGRSSAGAGAGSAGSAGIGSAGAGYNYSSTSLNDY